MGTIDCCTRPEEQKFKDWTHEAWTAIQAADRLSIRRSPAKAVDLPALKGLVWKYNGGEQVNWGQIQVDRDDADYELGQTKHCQEHYFCITYMLVHRRNTPTLVYREECAIWLIFNQRQCSFARPMVKWSNKTTVFSYRLDVAITTRTDKCAYIYWNIHFHHHYSLRNKRTGIQKTKSNFGSSTPGTGIKPGVPAGKNRCMFYETISIWLCGHLYTGCSSSHTC